MKDDLLPLGTRVQWNGPVWAYTTPYRSVGTIVKIQEPSFSTLDRYYINWDNGGAEFIPRAFFDILIEPNDIMKEIL